VGDTAMSCRFKNLWLQTIFIKPRKLFFKMPYNVGSLATTDHTTWPEIARICLAGLEGSVMESMGYTGLDILDGYLIDL